MISDDIKAEEEFIGHLKNLDSQSSREKMSQATRLALAKKDLSYLRIMGVEKEDKFYKSVSDRMVSNKKLPKVIFWEEEE